ncbi:hypothetical protein [Streptomyces katsurahamanus]|uniref:hypothetical protein n=1 Tax=Streptomyces katsurahamanus TaxID=2577098 RepID=UPI0018867AB3|nr:hypothetical protein [Streptomyces katsurahamanus]
MRPRTVLAVGVIAAALALPAVAPPAAGAVVVRSPPPATATTATVAQAATAAGRLGAVWAVRPPGAVSAVRPLGAAQTVRGLDAAAPVRRTGAAAPGAHPLVAVPAVRPLGEVRTVRPLGAAQTVRGLDAAAPVRLPGAAPGAHLLVAAPGAHPRVAAPAVRPPGGVPPVRRPGAAPSAHPLDAAPAAHPAAHPVADTRQPRCGAASAGRFPIGTRLHGGPTVHHPGGGFGQWSVELVNTTDRPCRNIHPVLVFTARDRGLTPARLMLEFYDSAASRWWPAELETTSEGEVVAILDADGAGGLTVPGRAAVAVPVRLALTADTPPNQVTVNAAIVQRRGDDGDWVGESGDYRFAVLDDNGYGATVTRDELATTGNSSLLRLGAALGTVLLFGGVLALAARRLHFPRGRPPGA